MPKSQAADSDANAFTQLTYLLHVVTALNSDRNLECSFPSHEKQANDELSPSDTALDSMVAILVQEHEVVAASFISEEEVVVVETDPNPSPDIDVSNTSTDIDVDVVPFLPGSHSLYPLQLAAVSNPEFNSSYDTESELPHKFRIQPDGKDLWPKIRDHYMWHCVLRGPMPLADHIATVSSFLNDYRKEPNKRDEFSKKFNCYLLSTCWKKISRRIRCWQSLGFIQFLAECEPLKLQISWTTWIHSRKTEPKPGPGDKTLIRFLQACEKVNGLIKSLVLDHIPDTFSEHGPFQIETLLLISRSNPLAFFSKKTIMEFHGLVTAAFIGFARAFIKIKADYSKLSKEDKIFLENDNKLLSDQQNEVLQAFKKALLYNRFLLLLISSSAFQHYFDLLVYIFSVKLLPSRGSIQIYQLFLKTLKDKEEGKEGKEPDEGDEKDEGDKGDEEDEEGEGVVSSTVSFFKFIKTFVVHFTAKRALENSCVRFNERGDVKIILFALDRSSLNILPGSWPQMVIMLKNLFPDTVTADKALEVLTSKIKGLDSESSKHQKLLAGFKKFIEGNKAIRISGGMHCETVLLTIALFYKSFLGEDSYLMSICELLLRTRRISVSKLCCRVCWILLTMFIEQLVKEKQHPTISFPSCHSTIYPVELPSWIPPEKVEQLIEHFGGLLRKELEIMMEGGNKAVKKGHVPHESESNISVSSSNRDDDDQEETEINQHESVRPKN